MKILSDQGAPAPLVQFFREHEVQQQGWAKLSNGELLRSAEDAGFWLIIDYGPEFAISTEPGGAKNNYSCSTHNLMAANS